MVVARCCTYTSSCPLLACRTIMTDAACLVATYGCVSSGRGMLLNVFSSTSVLKHCFAKAQQDRCTDHHIQQDDRRPDGRLYYHLRPWCDFDQIVRYVS